MQIKIQFQIEYKTDWGQEIRIIHGNDPSNLPENTICKTNDGIIWFAFLNLEKKGSLYYRYEMLSVPTITTEGQLPRSIDLDYIDKSIKVIYVKDNWRLAESERSIYRSAAFSEVIFKTTLSFKSKKPKKANIRFEISEPEVPRDKIIGVVGNISALGNWAKPMELSNSNYPIWTADIEIPDDVGLIEYKYVLIDRNTQEISFWEDGPNRQLPQITTLKDSLLVIHDEGIKYKGFWWRGTGIAIPVFSLRSKKGLGIGEFDDIKLMVDLAAEMQMNVIQVLPVNDTIANKTWVDSYPYAAISVYALHPLYISIPSIVDLKKYKWYKEYQKDVEQLNALSQIDFESVLNAKTKYLNLIYQDLGFEAIKSKEVKQFVAENEWVKAYSVFCHLRDIYKGPNFNNWGKHAEFSSKIIDEFWKKDQPKAEVGFYVFIQYHLDKQLKEAKAYGRSKSIILKGDLPIGIYRYSCDAWTNPSLYNMDQQAGAPPDDYAVNGQNWGFPTYNWEEMSIDGFAWWKSRMTQLATYFDALRIDHILGFFRIWSIPMNQASGTLGLFYPRMPVKIDELARFGVKGDLMRFTKPYIRTYMLMQQFETMAQDVIDTLLVEVYPDAYVFKSEYDTQMKVLSAVEDITLERFQPVVSKIIALHTEVLLIEEPNGDNLSFNPRITLHTTYSYRDLDDYTKRAFDNLYNHYFYQRHNEFWKNQAYWKLPALVKATNMLICGEDLGMIPATVPEVMTNLNIIPLEIQRMPKGETLFGNCKEYSYHTVCSPSCHDMSTIRGWWEGNIQTARNFYRLYMGFDYDPPRTCTTGLVEFINQDHLDSKSMLAIFPLQDLLGMDADLRLENPFAEQINEPSNPKHYWRYRLHLNLEQIIESKSIISLVKEMVKKSGRG